MGTDDILTAKCLNYKIKKYLNYPDAKAVNYINDKCLNYTNNKCLNYPDAKAVNYTNNKCLNCPDAKAVNNTIDKCLNCPDAKAVNYINDKSGSYRWQSVRLHKWQKCVNNVNHIVCAQYASTRCNTSNSLFHSISEFLFSFYICSNQLIQ